MLDVRSLPVRILDPARRGEPLQTLHNVGGGDFLRAGQENLVLLQTYGGLTPTSAILDVGCGAGRMAWPLAQVLSPQASYTGFDVSARAIRMARSRLGRVRPDFAFVEADVANAEYRTRGRASEEAYRFPVGDGVIDLAFATSVFSHMVLASIENYLRQAARVLKPSGRFVFTAYALTEERTEAIARGEGSVAFRPWREGSMVIDARSPERAIAHPLQALLAAIDASGLELASRVEFGRWIAPSTYEGGQDLIVVRRRS